MTGQTINFEDARKRAKLKKAAAVQRIADLENYQASMQRLIVRLFERLKIEAVILSQLELDDTDPERFLLVEVPQMAQYVVGIKKTGDEPLVITTFADRALKEVSEEGPVDAPG